MPKPKTIDLTRRESQIMEILYRRRRATVEAIRSELPDAPSPSSVRKLLEIMIERGLLAREYDGPRFVYFPAVKPEDASRSALKQLVRTFFDNSPGSAIAALLDMTSTPLSAAGIPAPEHPPRPRPRTGRRVMMPFDLDPATSAALSIAVKASVLLGAAALVQAVLYRRLSAATRHLVWTLAVVGLLLLPILSIALPEWAVVTRTAAAGAVDARPAMARVDEPATPPQPLAPVAARAESAADARSSAGIPLRSFAARANALTWPGVMGARVRRRRARHADSHWPAAAERPAAGARSRRRGRPGLDAAAARVRRVPGRRSSRPPAAQPRAQHADGFRHAPADHPDPGHGRHVARGPATRRGPSRAGARRAVRLPHAITGVRRLHDLLVPSSRLVGRAPPPHRARAGVRRPRDRGGRPGA